MDEKRCNFFKFIRSIETTNWTEHSVATFGEAADRKLVQAVLEGDRAAFEHLVQRYERLVSHIIWPLIRFPEDRADVAQDVFSRVYQHLPTFRFQCRLSTWIAHIAYNTSLTHLSKKRPLLLGDLHPNGGTHGTDASKNRETVLLEHQIVSNHPSPEHLCEAAELQQAIQRGLLRLTPRQRVVLVLYHWQGFSLADISCVLDRPVGTIKNDLFRARRALKHYLRQALELSEEDEHASQ